MWLETPKSDALTTRSDMDTIANQMVSHFVVCSSVTDPRCQVQSYQVAAYTLFKTYTSLLGFAHRILSVFAKFSRNVQFSQRCLAPKSSPQPLRRLALKNLLGRPFWQPKQRPDRTRSWWELSLSAVRWFLLRKLWQLGRLMSSLD